MPSGKQRLLGSLGDRVSASLVNVSVCAFVALESDRTSAIPLGDQFWKDAFGAMLPGTGLAYTLNQKRRRVRGDP